METSLNSLHGFNIFGARAILVQMPDTLSSVSLAIIPFDMSCDWS